MAANPRSRVEAHETEWFRSGGSDRLPNVDAQIVCEHGDLVYQRHVYVAERVLNQLGQLGLSWCGHGNGALDKAFVERTDDAQ